MDILFRNARILTMEDDKPIFLGCLAVEGNSIAYVGVPEPRKRYEKVIDCQGNLLIPGFKNAHAHSAMTFVRNHFDDASLQKWLFEEVIPREKRLQPGDEKILSKVAILEYLSGGITSCFDMYYSSDDMVAAAEEMGFRCVVLLTPLSSPDSIGLLKSKYLAKPDKDGLVGFRLGYHAEYTSDEEKMKALSKLSHELKCPIYTHNSETLSEVEGCKQRHDGLTPTEYMDKLGLLDYGGGGYHCVYFSKHDIELYKKHGCYVISCPGSNVKLASGIAPLSKYLESGVGLALGTDGPASNNALDMFYEMRLACVLQKLLLKKADAFPAYEALKAATVGGAKAMGLDDCDTLSPGKKADIVMIDLDKPELQPLGDIASSLVYSAGKSDVKMTMVNGRILYQDGKFLISEKPEDIYAAASLVAKRLNEI